MENWRISRWLRRTSAKSFHITAPPSSLMRSPWTLRTAWCSLPVLVKKLHSLASWQRTASQCCCHVQRQRSANSPYLRRPMLPRTEKICMPPKTFEYVYCPGQNQEQNRDARLHEYTSTLRTLEAPRLFGRGQPRWGHSTPPLAPPPPTRQRHDLHKKPDAQALPQYAR